MKKLFIIAICLIGLSPLLKAQMLNLNYQISVPIGDLKDYVDKASFRGFNLEYHNYLSERVSLGIAIGWDVYYQDKKNATGNFRFSGNDDIYTMTGNQYRYVNTVPMLLVPRYYFTDQNTSVRPFAGLGIGTSWTEKRLELGQYASTISRWQFNIAPEIGMYVPINDQFALNFGAKYAYATKASHGRIPAMQYFTFNIGIILMGVR